MKKNVTRHQEMKIFLINKLLLWIPDVKRGFWPAMRFPRQNVQRINNLCLSEKYFNFKITHVVSFFIARNVRRRLVACICHVVLFPCQTIQWRVWNVIWRQRLIKYTSLQRTNTRSKVLLEKTFYAQRFNTIKWNRISDCWPVIFTFVARPLLLKTNFYLVRNLHQYRSQRTASTSS